MHRLSQHRRCHSEGSRTPARGNSEMTGNKVIGAALPRKEDYRFVTGQGRYLDDIVVPGCLHAHFIRSPHAHARIASIDSAAALKAQGVVSIVTGRVLYEWTTPVRMSPPIHTLPSAEFT